MQTTRQATHAPGNRRPPSEGNVIWTRYLSLTLAESDAFRAACKAAGHGGQGWRIDTRKGQALGLIPTGRFQLYRRLFLDFGQTDLLADFLDEQPAAPAPAAHAQAA